MTSSTFAPERRHEVERGNGRAAAAVEFAGRGKPPHDRRRASVKVAERADVAGVCDDHVACARKEPRGGVAFVPAS